MGRDKLVFWGLDNVLHSPLRAGVFYNVIDFGSLADFLDTKVNRRLAKGREIVVVFGKYLTQWLAYRNGYLLVGFLLVERDVHPAIFIRDNLVG